jgi:hypothetical protein
MINNGQPCAPSMNEKKGTVNKCCHNQGLALHVPSCFLLSVILPNESSVTYRLGPTVVRTRTVVRFETYRTFLC